MMQKFKNFLAVLISSMIATFLVAGVVYAATTISTDITTGGLLSVAGLSSLNGQASTTQLTASSRIYVGTSGLTNIVGDTATSTFSGGVNLTTGCFAINGTCVGSTATSSVTSVVASNGTLTITPTVGNVTATLNLANANTWTAVQTFNAIPVFSSNISVANTVNALSIESPSVLSLGASSSTAITIGRSAITTTMPGALTLGGTLSASGVASSSFANGINLTSGCFAVAGSCITISTSTGVSTIVQNTWTALQIFNAQATSTQFTATSRLYVGSAPNTTVILPSNATSTFGGIQGSALNITGTATSTFLNGIALSGGCITVLGTCIGTSSGASLGSNNIWTGTQQFVAATTSFASDIYVGHLISANSLDTFGGPLSVGTTTASSITIGRSSLITSFPGPINASSTLTVGNGSSISGMVFGTCTIATPVPITNATSAIFSCTGAAGISTTHRVFIESTGAVPTGLNIEAASSTGPNTIGLRIFNMNSTSTSPGASAVNYFGIQ